MRQLLLLLLLSGLAYGTQTATKSMTITINPANTATITWLTTYQTIDGFGIAEPQTPADYLHQLVQGSHPEVMGLLFDPNTLGASASWLRPNIYSDTVAQGCGTSDCTFEPSIGTLSFTGDNQVWMLQQAQSSWGTKIASIVYSAPAWATSNGTTGNDGSCPYILAGQYQNFTNYLATYIAGYKNHFNLDIHAVIPMGEPTSCNSYYNNSWTSAQALGFIGYVRNTFQNPVGYIIPPENTPAGITAVQNALFICCDQGNWSDSSTADVAYGWTHDATTMAWASIGFDAHNYLNSVPTYFNFIPPHKIWLTESHQEGGSDCSINDGLFTAKNIHDWLVSARAQLYVYWWFAQQGCSSAMVITVNTSNVATGYTLTPRFYAFGNYSHFVRPGWVRIDVTESPAPSVYVSAYKEASSGKLAVVAINQGTTSQSVAFNLTTTLATVVTPYLTDATHNLAAQTTIPASGGSWSFTLPAKSITTFSSQH